MIVRIVRMEFSEETLPAFLGIFDSSKQHIRNFPGCLHLELMKDLSHPYVRYTYSRWENTASLENYRNSSLFASVWPRTKALFAARPQAYSLVSEEIIN
ncbi:MAG: antibiotic biosynthesis monooxygenase family protein [Bacteroidia bacterium]